MSFIQKNLNVRIILNKYNFTNRMIIILVSKQVYANTLIRLKDAVMEINANLPMDIMN